MKLLYQLDRRGFVPGSSARFHMENRLHEMRADSVGVDAAASGELDAR